LPGSWKYLSAANQDNLVYWHGSAKVSVTPDDPNATVFHRDWKNGRHLEGMNMLFVDGHVKWFATQTVMSKITNPNRDWVWSKSNATL